MTFTSVVYVVCLILGVFMPSSRGEDITKTVFGENTNFLPAAFGDFNSDRRTDLFVVSEDGKTIEVLMSQPGPPFLHRQSDSDSAPKCTYESLNIQSVVPGDFDGDGALDAMILSLNTSVSPLYQVFILWGDLGGLTCAPENSSILSIPTQPLVVDVNGDMIPDLFGDDVNGTRTFWVFGPDRQPPKAIPMPVTGHMPYLKNPSSHAFIDLNNDLVADLWITAVDRYEVWLKVGSEYVFHSSIHPPEAITFGQTSFADVNQDGHINALVPAFKDTKN